MKRSCHTAELLNLMIPSLYSSSAANCEIIGVSPATVELLRLCHRFARSSAPVLLVGAVGCEFEKVAALIHRSSDRADQPFVKQRCVHWQDAMDPLRAVGSGTLFVEGIQYASQSVQLRLIAEMDEARVAFRQADGATPVPPRIIASANDDLYSLVENGLLMDDLHWHLSALYLRVPSLSERMEDIPAIAQQMLDQVSPLGVASTPRKLSDSSCRVLQQYSWPGNYRQLQNVLQRAVVLTEGDELEICQAELEESSQYWQSQPAQLQFADALSSAAVDVLASATTSSSSGPAESDSVFATTAIDAGAHAAIGKSVDMQQLVQAVVEKGILEAERAHRESHSFVVDRVEKALIAAVLAQCGNVQKAAAQKLGINRNTLHKKIKQYGLEE